MSRGNERVLHALFVIVVVQYLDALNSRFEEYPLDFFSIYMIAKMAEPQTLPEPDVQDGIQYWNTQSADYDGVLGELPGPVRCPSS